MSVLSALSARLVTGAALAVALLSAVSALTLQGAGPSGRVPADLHAAVVTALWVAAGLALLVGALPVVRRRLGESRLVTLTATAVLGVGLTVNAASLNGEIARFPQSFTSLLGVVAALAGATLAALSIATREPARRDHSSL